MSVARLVVSITMCQAAGILGSIFTAQSVETWYAALEKPVFSPPNWLFAPVWIALYTMMGISLYLVWQKHQAATIPRTIFIVFGIQLVLNALWSFLFFGLRSPLLGFIEISLLWMAIAMTVVLFWRVSQTAAVLLVPYLLWVTFAAMLNFSVWQLNAM